MFKIRTLFVLGIWTAVLSQLGFPLYLKNILFALTGALIVYLSIIFYKEHKDRAKANGQSLEPDNFSENREFIENNN